MTAATITEGHHVAHGDGHHGDHALAMSAEALTGVGGAHRSDQEAIPRIERMRLAV